MMARRRTAPGPHHDDRWCASQLPKCLIAEIFGAGREAPTAPARPR